LWDRSAITLSLIGLLPFQHLEKGFAHKKQKACNQK